MRLVSLQHLGVYQLVTQWLSRLLVSFQVRNDVQTERIGLSAHNLYRASTNGACFVQLKKFSSGS
jgi:hypothetical protein